jgi:hypothetical protein
MTQLPYQTLPNLANLYLEDSYVLALQTADQYVVLTVDAVLTSAHPHYHPPRPNEQYCYERGQLIFPNVTQFQWIPSALPPAVEASGALDYGNIDIFYVEYGRYHLEGDWGVLDIVSDPPNFELASSQQ